MPQLSLGTRLSAGGPLTSLPRRVAAILRKFGANAHVWMPGPGVPVLGPELISNGDFSNGTTGWNISGGSAPYGVSAAGGELSFAGSAAYINVSKLDILTIGKTYQCTFTVKSRSAGSVRFNGGGSVGTFRTAPGTYTEVFTATAHDDFSIQDTNGALVATIDDVSVKELLGYSTLLNGFQAANYLEANASGNPQVVDQPVGYVGDAANVTLGPELVTNGDFSSATGWVGTGATFDTVAGTCTITSADGSYAGVSRNATSTLVQGRVYQYEIKVNSITGASLSIVVGAAQAQVLIGTAGVHRGVIAAGATQLIEVKRTSGAVTAVIDYLNIKEIVGAIPATQATTANKPILRRVPILGPELLNNGDFSNGTTGWLAMNGASLSVSGGELTVTSVGAAYGGANQGVAATAGKTYRIEWSARRPVGPAWVVIAGVVGQPLNNLIPASTVTRGGITVTAVGATVSVTLQCQNVNGTQAIFDDVSVREITGYRDAYYWEFDGTNDALVLSGPAYASADDQCVVAAAACSSYATQRVLAAPSCSASTYSKNASLIIGTDGAPRARWTNDAPADFTVTSPTPVPVGVPVVMSARKLGATGSLRVNGVAQGTPVTLSGTITATSGGIAAERTSTPSGYALGSIFATIAIKGTVSDSDLRILEKWVGQQAGVTIT